MMPLPRHVAAMLAALVLVGCASGGGTTTQTSKSSPIIVNDERDAVLSAAMGERVISADQSIYASVAAPPDKVYQALIVAYSELGVPATIVNPKDGLVATLNR